MLVVLLFSHLTRLQEEIKQQAWEMILQSKLFFSSLKSIQPNSNQFNLTFFASAFFADFMPTQANIIQFASAFASAFAVQSTKFVELHLISFNYSFRCHNTHEFSSHDSRSRRYGHGTTKESSQYCQGNIATLHCTSGLAVMIGTTFQRLWLRNILIWKLPVPFYQFTNNKGKA